MDKIAFVVVRYGLDVNGGAEYHVRMLAERLANKYHVEVLTTCVKDYITGDNYFFEGEEIINQVLVRRFQVDPVDKEHYSLYWKKTKKAKKAETISLSVTSFDSNILFFSGLDMANE